MLGVLGSATLRASGRAPDGPRHQAGVPSGSPGTAYRPHFFAGWPRPGRWRWSVPSSTSHRPCRSALHRLAFTCATESYRRSSGER